MDGEETVGSELDQYRIFGLPSLSPRSFEYQDCGECKRHRVRQVVLDLDSRSVARLMLLLESVFAFLSV